MHRRGRVIGASLAAVVLVVSACGGDDDSSTGEATTTSEVLDGRPSGYVALGDSFSAGVGAAPFDDASGKCQRSELSWPYVLDSIGEGDADVTLLDNRACSGARIEHLLGGWTDRRLPAQIPGEPDASVGLVTVTVGGNDAGFTDIVAQCVLSDCTGLPAGAEFVGALASVAERLATEVYPALRAAYPEAVLVQVGYPRLTPAEGEPLDGTCGWISAGEQPAIAQVVQALDDTFEAAAARADDVRFVSVFDAFEGHELCTAEPWVNGVLSVEAGPAHPTAAGYEAMAAAVAEALAEG